MSYETILYDVQNGVGTITFNRPETLNAFNQQMVKEAIQAMKAASRDAAVRCVVMTGSGRGFSSGQDLMEAA
ncbi:MAG: enoyl-CoA hydratase/isomerase family protein, partial [Anaerolineales bacterium]|nr:enoyl-CoA hydratase/isomerase family protein [Anaerolineales bacterium]